MMTKTLNQAIFVGLVSVFAFSSAGADDVVESFEETLNILEEQGVDPVYLELINAKMNMMASDFELRLLRSEYELEYVNMQAEYEIRIANMQRELDMAKSKENVD